MEPVDPNWTALMDAWGHAHPGWSIVGYAPDLLERDQELPGTLVQVRQGTTGTVLSGHGLDLTEALQHATRQIREQW